ncbi:E3 ubiquitin-protein ligase hel2 [Neltuma alba]|uniref:E3 ubiquitin-protein ligase hel2 n=1 Tax=Neltuma alba TaxID=207710 RepID=UPI0010A57C9A|nr:E3 ubiquitin-protein ligase hel2-like [Prosopis alba]
MDDCCAVCAEPLEWVAYGPCLHREVCSTCVARLRFICDDRRCCICKTQCDCVFVTKALGDFTRMINNFSVLPSDAREGKVGSYWYHEDTNAFFDDVDHYKMIKAMCKLSCSVCDNMEEQAPDASKRRARFRNIEQLKGHLFRYHRLLMCSLCLEGRKVFICEQKLYTRAQLNQHISTGDSEVDGSESERGGFMGHPMCEFCRTPFYGDNELYTHMSTEHFTCHICQRQHPGQYEYYKNYDDLETHFRQEHFLCEDEACLAKKFIVFQSEAEMKRHNAIEHGGRMSRSKRNAALQIPTSFRYRHSNQQDQRRGRGRTFRRDPSESELSLAIQASFETASAESTSHDLATSSSGQVALGYGDFDNEPGIQSSESLATSSSELPSRYLQALGQNSRSSPLEDSSFPPLPIASINGQAKPKNESEGSSSNTMAAHLRRHSNRNVSALNPANGWPVASRGSVQSSSNPMQSKKSTNVASGVSGNSSQTKTVINRGLAPSTYASSVETTQRTAHGHLSPGMSREIRDNGRIVHSVSAPNLIESSPLQSEPSFSDFPPVSATKVNKLPATSQSSTMTSAEGVDSAANKSLVEKIRSALDFDQDRYAIFKDISAQYRHGIIDTGTYLDYVQQFGLSHLVLELARLCPDPQKRKELVDSYNASLQRIAFQENDWGGSSIHHKDGKVSKKGKGKGKGKGKSIDVEERHFKDNLEDSFISTVRQLQLNHKPSEENAEVLSKGDYRSARGKSKILADEQLIGTNSRSVANPKHAEQSEASLGKIPNQRKDEGAGGSRQRKKASKFIRMRLGDGSVEALLDLRSSNAGSDPGSTEALDGNKSDPGGLPVRGVWRNGGGHKLFS